MRVERRGRIDVGERGGHGLAEMVRRRRCGIITTRARPRAADSRDRSASPFGRQVGGVDDVLDADGDAAQRAGALCAGIFVTADERADGFFVRRRCLDDCAMAASAESSPDRYGAEDRRARSSACSCERRGLLRSGRDGASTGLRGERTRRLIGPSSRGPGMTASMHSTEQPWSQKLSDHERADRLAAADP